MSDARYFEKDPEAERHRIALVEKGCMIYRQWGGNPAVAIFLPTLPGAAGPRIVVKHYADFPDRASARKEALRVAFTELELIP